MPDQEDFGQMPYIVALVGQLAGSRFSIRANRVCAGRDASQCQIVLTQGVISRVQAAFELDERGLVTLVDLSSKQTTFVNGKPIERCQLRDSDRVGFGPGGVVAFAFHSAIPAAASKSVHAVSVDPDGSLKANAAERPIEHITTHIGESVHFASTPLPSGSPSQHVAGTTTLRAAHVPEVRLGRSPENHLVLNAPGVSRYHAILTYKDGCPPTIADLGSTNGTFVNGEPLTEPRIISPQDLVFLGGFLLHVDGRTIRKHDLSASSITAQSLTRVIEGKVILSDVSLAISPREFVGLMGPSGCGKSTLLAALNGLRPATNGRVCINDLDLYRNFNALRRSMGYVPQRDVLHDSLTVERTLHYAARMRLPTGTSATARDNIVNDVIETVGLQVQRSTSFSRLSGGQQKRLSLAFELVTKPSFIFLDEPTSPLDPETTENMMLLFRRLADEGRIVIMVTHKFEKFYEMHRIAMLTHGGRLAYFGPPGEALDYFGCKEPGDIYRLIGAHDPDEISARFKRSSQYERYISGRIAESEALARSSEALGLSPSIGQEGAERNFGISQWVTLTRRYLEVKLNDRRNMMLLLAQAPLIAFVLAIIVRNSPVNDSKTIFISAIISIWFGANNAVREIVSETGIYVRERLVNLKIPSYVFSKFVVLSGIGSIQCLLFVSIIVGMGRLKSEDFFSLMVVLYLTSLAGIATGLFLSALVRSTEKAMSVLPLVLIPQLLLSGFMVSIDDIYYTVNHKPATESQFQRYQDFKEAPPQTLDPRTSPVINTEPVYKHDGLGTSRYAAAMIVARWTVDALANDVSIEDKDARERLPTLMTVVGYEATFAGKAEEDIVQTYRERVAFDCVVLALFSIVFLSLTMWALKRKDVL